MSFPEPVFDRFLRGTMVGRYLLLDLVGSGGMGRVYAAYDPELDRRVAVKLVAASYARKSSQAPARLVREAKAMARLTHPNVVAVYDAGEYQGGVFLAMELVEGGNLSKWLVEPRTHREILDVFRAAGHGLAAAHQAGLVHRDFKPDNVLVGKNGRVCVTDFGLARPLDDDAGDEPIGAPASPLALPSLTRTGAVLGTPGYMAPEQYLAKKSTPQTDQFAFCVSLYRALYGSLPFTGETPDAVRSAVLGGHLTRADAQSVPGWLRSAVLRGLNSDPGQRYPSMDAVLDALARDPVVRRRKWAIGAAVVVALAVPSSLYVRSREVRARSCDDAGSLDGTWGTRARQAVREAFMATRLPYAETAWRSTADAVDRYAVAWATTSEASCRATRIEGDQSEARYLLRRECLARARVQLDALVNLLSHADVPTVQRALPASALLPRVADCDDPSGTSTVPGLDDLRARLANARALYFTGNYAAAIAQTEPLVGSGPKAFQAEVLDLLGSVQERAGKLDAASKTLRSAMWAAEASGQDALIAHAANRLVFTVGVRQDRFEEGKQWAELSAAAIERLGGSDVLESERLTVLASVYSRARQPERMVALCEEAIPLRERSLGAQHPDTAATVNNLALGLDALGKTEQAIAQYRRALAIYEGAVGMHHPELIRVLSNLAIGLAKHGQLREAVEHARRAMALADELLSPDDPSLVRDRIMMAWLLTQAGDAAAATVHARDALASLEADPHPNPSQVKDAVLQLADTLGASGRPEEALLMWRRGLSLTRGTDGDDLDAAFALTGIAEVELALGKPAKALADAERALAQRERTEGNDRADLARTRLAVARALWDTNRDRERAKRVAASAREALGTTKDDRVLHAIDAWTAAHP